ncbi:MAG: AAA family ATPase, partial [Planctomycetota bacterium]
MSEYMEKHNASKLIGAPPGYVGFEEGGQLTEKIRRRPYAVVLLDEIEKAHPNIFNMLLQIMEEGRLTDSFGRHVDFRNVILIMTSNVGADLLKNKSTLGFGRSAGGAPDDTGGAENIKTLIQGEIERFFRPEFLNRLDDVIFFRPLERRHMEEIIHIELKHIRERLADRGISLDLTDESLKFIIDRGFDQQYGARPLKRALEKLIEDPLAEEILRGSFEGQSQIKVIVAGNELSFVPEYEEEKIPSGVSSSDSENEGD